MKKFALILVLVIPIKSFAQIEEDHLCITNKKDQIYAIISENFFNESNPVKQEEDVESYSDFVFHSNKLKKLVDIKIKIYISSLVKFNNAIIDINERSPFTYIFVKKDNVKPKILKGIYSYVGLEQQIKSYFSEQSKKNSKLRKQY